jgi:type I restriction-modification system DNA methylase subunit
VNASKEILELIERFDRNKESYLSGQYNETQLRREFIDPFFELLGWDVNNKQGYAEAYKDVIHEDAIKIGSAIKAPDYCFRIGGTRKFFVEAKKPSVNLKDDMNPAFQLRRYAWSAKLPLSILTDFEELAVYDCRITPAKTDKASTARIMYLTYGDYVEKWDEIASIFSREAILKGSFDKYAETGKHKKGTAEVDDAFLKEIESWRDMLARNIATRNPELSQRELNFAVQRTIDRIIFLRICEDRGIEEYGRLMSLMNGANVYRRLLEFFRHADEKYNSGLFHFDKEKDRHEMPDELTPILAIDDKHLKDIIKRLYYPESPYEFSVLPANILGQVYEQFLGKVIRLTAGHRAIVEEKPEVRKAGGVYYTPTYIVDYIVKNTVGKLMEGKTPKEASKIRILDPACGSGSFLLGAYQYLLDWHRDWYINDSKEKWATGKKPSLYQAQGGDWHLTTSEKKRILLNNIYGVDIDSQAVEVTKLSLLLKVLEGENNQTIERQFKFFHERALPDLGDNVKCGNSLVGPDFYQQQTMLNEEERYRINVFDWNAEFPEIMKAGGFDAVIGNPPYGALFGDAEKAYIQKKFQSYKYRYDSYIYFIEKALGLAKKGGYISYITPELWLKLENCAPLRKFIAANAGFECLKVFGENVFTAAVVSTIVFVLHRAVEAATLKIEMNGESWQLLSNTWKSADGYSIDYRLKPGTNDLAAKIKSERTQPLSVFGEAIQGITPYDKYRGQNSDLIKRRGYHYTFKHDKNCGKWLAGKDVSRYGLGWSGEWLCYGSWLAAPRDPKFFAGIRLLFREVPGPHKRIQATMAEETYYHGHSITPFKPHSAASIDLRYLIGIVNSKLLSWYGGLTLPNFGKDVFPKLNPQDIKELPIRVIDYTNKQDKARHDKIVALVEQMLSLNKRLTAAKTDHEKTVLQRQIEATDKQIDQLVYELYGLTEEEIAIVEKI